MKSYDHNTDHTRIGLSRSYRIGDRNRRIAIQREIVTRTDTGAERKAWTVMSTVWAELQHIKATHEDADTNHISAIHICRWVIRYRRDIDYSDRIAYENSIYEILSIAEQGQRDLLIIDTLKIVS